MILLSVAHMIKESSFFIEKMANAKLKKIMLIIKYAYL